jgi:hypothetical protein
MTVIPYNEIQAETLQRLIEDFVTREGAVQGHVEIELANKVAAVLSQIRMGLAVIVFDEETESCTIVTKRDLPGCGTDDRRIAENEST